MIVVPSGAVNSFGGYDASVPNTILPSADTLCGTFAASASSLVGVGIALLAAAPADVGAADEPLPSPPEPHPASTASAAHASAAGSVRGSDTGTTSMRAVRYPRDALTSAVSGPLLCIGCYAAGRVALTEVSRTVIRPDCVVSRSG